MSDSIIMGMIIDAPDQVIQLTGSIASIDTMIASFQEKQDSLKSSVCDKVSSDLESYLIGTKFTPVENYFMYKGTNFNDSLETTGNFTDWKVYENSLSSNITYENSAQFSISGDETTIFIHDKDISFSFSDSTSYSYSTVVSSTYDSIGDKTTVIINDSILNINMIDIWIKKYSYILSDDITIDSFKDQWDFGHDYIILPMGSTGTYGTKDNILKLNSAKAMLTYNKTKINDSITVLVPFV